MLICIGDLIDDVVVRQRVAAFSVGSDTDSHVVRRRGGSAANVAATAQRIGLPSRLLATAGADRIGEGLVDEMRLSGVDTRFVQRRGRSATVIALVDSIGERSMLTDRGSAVDVRLPPADALRSARAVHIPLYSLATPPLADTAMSIADHVDRESVVLTLDVSSASLLDELGPARVNDLLAAVEPDVVLANDDEAGRLGSTPGVLVARTGSKACHIVSDGHITDEVAALELIAVDDTTGAGDAFAAGVIAGLLDDRHDVVGACRRGHRIAAALLVGRGARRHDRQR
ncbi:MAG: PfkB family carbohydrate kinase [Actinomycetota bacterium]